MHDMSIPPLARSAKSYDPASNHTVEMLTMLLRVQLKTRRWSAIPQNNRLGRNSESVVYELQKYCVFT